MLWGKTNPVHYNAAGGVTSAIFGNGVSETRTYDGRQRLTGISDGSLYTLTIPSGGYAPNSDVLAANDNVNSNWTYAYDAFNRLISANATGQAYTYAYDRFGNRWQQNGPHQYQASFGANNRIASGTGVAYDAAGDTTNDGTTTYTYDAEGRVKTAYNATSGTSTYVYDAEGRRVQKTTAAGGTVDFLYDLGGREITQTSSTGAWTRGEVYAGGRHVATYTGTGGTTYFIHSDWLGTERLRSALNGSSAETCTSLPFGDWLTCAGSDVSPMHFTGKEHDSESGLENFGARYDSSAMGRFMSPDWSKNPDAVPYSVFDNPQALNLYAYVRNNPTTTADSDGHYHCDPDQWNPSTNTLTAGGCHSDFWDYFAVAMADGHHYFPKQIWPDLEKTSDAYRVLNRTVSGALKNPRLSNSYDKLHRGLNKDMQKLVDETERDLKKSVEDFDKGDWEKLGSRVEAEGGNIQAFNERLAALEPDAASFGDALAQALVDVYGPASNAADATSAIATDAGGAVEGAAEGAAEEGIIPGG